MNPRNEPAWQVAIDPAGDKTKRQHVDSCANSSAASDVVTYVRNRVPPTDIVSANYGSVVAPGGDYDLSRLKEPENAPPDDWQAPMKPLVIP